jgi:hypothetical protein
LVWSKTLENGFYEVLGLRTRNKNRRSDFEGKAVELLLTGDVLDGLVFKAASNVGFVDGFFDGGELARRMSQKSSAGNLQGVKQQTLGVAVSVGTEMFAGGELLGGDGEGLT